MNESSSTQLNFLALETLRVATTMLDAPHVNPWAEANFLPAVGLAADIACARLASIFEGMHGLHLGTEVFDRLLFLANECMHRARDAGDDEMDLTAAWANRMASAAYSLVPQSLFGAAPPQHAAFTAAHHLVPVLDRIDPAMLALGTVSAESASAVAQEMGMASGDGTTKVIFQIKGEGREAATTLLQAIPLADLVSTHGRDMLRGEWWCDRHARVLRLIASTNTARKLADPPQDQGAYLLNFVSAANHSQLERHMASTGSDGSTPLAIAISR